MATSLEGGEQETGRWECPQEGGYAERANVVQVVTGEGEGGRVWPP